MGSFEEDELVQMVHDFIESESSSPPSIFTTCSTSNSLPLRLTHQSKCLSLQVLYTLKLSHFFPVTPTKLSDCSLI